MGVGRPIARTNFYEIEMKRLEVKWGGGKRPNAITTGSEKQAMSLLFTIKLCNTIGALLFV